MEDIISEVTERMFDTPKEEVFEEESVTTTDAYDSDVYEKKRKALKEETKKTRPNGAPAKMNDAAKELINKAKKEYDRANADYQHLLVTGNGSLAKQTLDVYMNDVVLPIIEALVGYYGVDMVLNATNIIEAIDGIVLTGNGTGEGYTQSFIETMYGQFLGSQEGQSDQEVLNAVDKINKLLREDNIRGAVLAAQRINGKILNGEVLASGSDYDLIYNAANYIV